jgi:ubiquinone/menaquinone biosynthesis C-methylase UbiE
VALARGGKVLELGAGTGRVLLPLAHHGVEAHGIAASQAMVANLLRKQGGASVPVTVGNFADVPVTSDYSLIFSVISTFLRIGSPARGATNDQSLANSDGQFGSVIRFIGPGRW